MALERVFNAYGAEVHHRAGALHHPLDRLGIAEVAMSDRFARHGWAEGANVRAPNPKGPFRQMLAQPGAQRSRGASKENWSCFRPGHRHSIRRSGASAPHRSALKRLFWLDLAVLRRQEREILRLAVLDVIDADLRQRPGVGGLQQVQHQAMLSQRHLEMIGVERVRSESRSSYP
jgi:hypothetical protein